MVERAHQQLVEASMDAPEQHTFGRGVLCVYAHPYPTEDTNHLNEDALAWWHLGKGHFVLAIADGVGGLPSGNKASEAAIGALHAALTAPAIEPGSTARDAILDAFEQANRRILKLGIGAATTLAVVEILKGQIRPYHTGDSNIVVVGQRGRLKLWTTSHSPVGYAVEAGILDQDEALHHEDLNMVSNLVGSSDMRIEVGAPLPLSPKDTVFLGSDGIFDNLLAEELVEYIRKGPLEKSCEALKRKCVHRMTKPKEGEPSKPDDHSFVAFRMRTRPPRAPSR